MQLVPTISTKLELGTRRMGQIGWSRVWLAETPCVANATAGEFTPTVTASA